MDSSPAASTLDARGVFVHFGERQVLQDVSLTVAPGEWVALIGPNGAGKSTLMRAMLGLVPFSGDIRVSGTPVGDLPRRELARMLAWVPQRLDSTPPFSIEELVLQGRAPRHQNLFESAVDREVATRFMARTGVLELADRRLSEVSGGEAQRALVAAAMAQEPGCVLLDEPSASLDPRRSVELMQLLDQMRREGTAVVTATHDINLVARYCDRLVLIVDGKIAVDGPPAAVLTAVHLHEAYGDGLRILNEPGVEPGWVLPDVEAVPQTDTSQIAAPALSSASLTSTRFVASVSATLLLTLLVVALAPLFGATSLDLSSIGDAESVSGRIFWQIRVPRVLLAMLAGASLSVAGAGFQALLRNPLATPYTLGIAGGASLGAVLVLLLGVTGVVAGFSPVPLAAFGGAFGSILAVYGLARAMGRADTTDLLLAGIAWSMVSAACVLLLQYLADPSAAFQMIRWLVGGLDIVGYQSVVRPLPFVVLGVVVLLWHARALNLLAVDEALAAARGLAVGRTRLVVFAAASLATGAVVGEVGPIGFVGLIVPHAVRAVVGPDHRVLLPCSVLAGGAFLVLADTAARTIMAPGELPVGVLTALVGGPMLVLLLVRQRVRG